MKQHQIKEEYVEKKELYHRLCVQIVEQLKMLIEKYQIRLAVPVEYRVKTWESIEHKLETHPGIENLSDLNDIAGLRIITLFQSDVEKMEEIIQENFQVLKKEDTSKRLDVDRFGYESVHFDIELLEEWCKLPTFAGLEGLTAEIQVRTASQHIWAMSSHVLQYKKESDVPKNVQRSINRAAALLELVDLEFERVLAEKSDYIEGLKDEKQDEQLNVDNLKFLLDEEFPKENEEGSENYGRLLWELQQFDVCRKEQLREVIRKNLDKVMKVEKQYVNQENDEIQYLEPKDIERLEKGVFFTYMGLLRNILKEEYGSKRVNEVIFKP